MRAALALAAGLLFAGCATPKYGLEDSGEDFAREGAYVSGAATAGIEKFHGRDPYEDGSNSGIGGALRIGYRSDDGVAAELFLEDERGYSLDSRFGSTPVEFRNIGVNGKLYILEGRVQPFLQVGVGWTRILFNDRTQRDVANGIDYDVPYTDDAFLARGGVGCDFYVSKSVAFFVEGNFNFVLSQPSKDTRLGNLHHLQGLAGILVRF